jgi:hypothetical protein
VTLSFVREVVGFANVVYYSRKVDIASARGKFEFSFTEISPLMS